jgi:hypothetical protein
MVIKGDDEEVGMRGRDEGGDEGLERTGWGMNVGEDDERCGMRGRG